METLTSLALAHELDGLLKDMYVLGAELADAGRTLLIQLRRRSGRGAAAGGRVGADPGAGPTAAAGANAASAAPPSGWVVLSSCGGESALFFTAKKPKFRGALWPAPLSRHQDESAQKHRSPSHQMKVHPCYGRFWRRLFIPGVHQYLATNQPRMAWAVAAS